LYVGNAETPIIIRVILKSFQTLQIFYHQLQGWRQKIPVSFKTFI